MRPVTTHIISSLAWDTTFNEKEKVGLLQERLSSLSKLKLQREIYRIFDTLCPEDQTWRMESLELDLGIIDYDNLEAEMLTKLNQQLTEKLNDLITYGYANGKEKIEILADSLSQIDALASFLLAGVFPWSFKYQEGSVNGLLETLLETEKEEVLSMIREMGKAHVDVRRRIALQIKEPLIIKIIEGLEPTDNKQIIDFSEELVNLQNKEAVVQASSSEFKKNVWFWILNYLLSERGTIFNKINFAKSSIKQMANHYNVSYSDLLMLIDQATTIVAKRFKVDSAFVTTIKELTNEQHFVIPEPSGLPKGKLDDNWNLLKELFLNDEFRSKGKKRIFNQLLLSFSQKDKFGFRNFILEFSKKEIAWIKIISDLEDNALEVVLGSINPANTPVVLKGISFLNTLDKDFDLGLNRNNIWHSGLNLIMANKDTFLNETVVLNHLIKELIVKNTGINASIRLQLLTQVEYKSGGPFSSELYSAFNKQIATSLTEIDSQFYKLHLNELIDKLTTLLSQEEINNEEIYQLRKSLFKNIRYKPDLALAALSTRIHNSVISQLLETLFSPSEILELFFSRGKIIGKVVFFIFELLNESEVAKKFRTDNIRSRIIKAALFTYIKSPYQSSDYYLKQILKEIFNSSICFSSSSEQQGFMDLIQGHSELNSICGEVNIKLEANLNEESDISQILKLIEQGKSYNEVMDKIRSSYSSVTLIKYRRDSLQEKSELLNYIIPEGSKLRDNLISKYTDLLAKEIKETGLKEILNELFWKCILKSAGRYGQLSFIKNCFHAEVLSRFSVSFQPENQDYNKVVNLISKKKVVLNSGDLNKLIQNCLKDGVNVIENEGEELFLSELLATSMDTNPYGLRDVLQQTNFSSNGIHLLQQSISFDDFCSGIVYDSSTFSKGIKDIHSLSMLILPDCSTQIQEDLLNMFWKKGIQVLKTGHCSINDLSELVQETVAKTADKKSLISESIINQLNESELIISNELREALLKNLFVPQNEIISKLSNSGFKVSRILEDVESRGLLYEYCQYIFCQENIPDWVTDHKTHNVIDQLKELFTYRPFIVQRLLKREFMSEHQMDWLHKNIGFNQLIASIRNLNVVHSGLLETLKRFYWVLGNITISGVSRNDLQAMLFRKTLKAWKANHWKIVSPEFIWNELVWELGTKYTLTKENVVREFEKYKTQFPPALQISFGVLKQGSDRVEAPSVVLPVNKLKKIKSVETRKPEAKSEGLLVKNAGIVLINNYVTTLFERVGLTKDRVFVNTEAQINAVHYLQYVATGLSQTEESLLSLNKVLCGLQLTQPISDGVEIPEENKKIISGLIKAIINHWPSIGDSSINGFRGNWLIRDGKLTEYEEKWELIVEKRAYDILIEKSPFSFSIIKYPWMGKPLHVTWSH